MWPNIQDQSIEQIYLNTTVVFTTGRSMVVVLVSFILYVAFWQLAAWLVSCFLGVIVRLCSVTEAIPDILYTKLQ